MYKFSFFVLTLILLFNEKTHCYATSCTNRLWDIDKEAFGLALLQHTDKGSQVELEFGNLPPLHPNKYSIIPNITSRNFDRIQGSAVPGLYYDSSIVDDNTIRIAHNSGFFSCCSIRLNDIIQYFNYYKKTPLIVDTSSSFSWYKPNGSEKDITYDFFKSNEMKIVYEKYIDFGWNHQYLNYKGLDYSSISPFIDKYFSPSKEVEDVISFLETKYEIESYNNLCVLFYRGNDKIRETRLCEYSEIIEKAKLIQEENLDTVFLIQSDETEFIETMLSEFPNSIYFKDEIRHMKKNNSTVDVIFRSLNYEFSKYYLAITILMSKCKYIVCGSSGNCSIWIMLYRKHADNVYQYLNGLWIE